MQSPLSTGTVLQNRYRLVEVLGQGGFGRTYLAEDQSRFNERCALKEFMPPANDYGSDKGRELFQREAAVLYQVDHPQIPKFQATFEEQGRIFLVQDYVEGPTYRQVLEGRSQSDTPDQAKTFTDSEIQHLLHQILPVLSYIHGLGIVHRDISPDNIILRDRDQMPVLIDFGVVKDLASRVYASDDANATLVQPTTVGKSGYAPSEQIQTGRAYPSSDLYALAATAVVLLTGKEPQTLFDGSELRWNWQPHAEVSPVLATVLDTMLIHQPGQRYASANEVLQALSQGNPVSGGNITVVSDDAAGGDSAGPQSQSSPAYPVPQTAPRSPNSVGSGPASTAKTVAFGRPAPKTEALGLGSTSAAGSSGDNVPRAADDDMSARSLWDDPWSVTAVGIGLVVVTGFASWALVNWLLRPQPESPVANPSPTAIATSSPTPTPSASASATPTPIVRRETFTQALELRPGIPVQDEGVLKSNQTLVYRFYGERSQELEMRISGPGVVATLRTSNGGSLGPGTEKVRQWKGALPVPSSYEIELRTVEGQAESKFTIFTQLSAAPNRAIPLPDPDVTITPSVTPTPVPTPSITPRPTPTPTPTPQPTPTPTPTSTPQPTPTPTPQPTPTPTPTSTPQPTTPTPTPQLTPQPTPQNQSFQGVVSAARSETRSLTIQTNQTVQVSFRSPAAQVTVYGPEGNPIPSVVNHRDGTVSFKAPTSGAYQFEVKTDVETDFNLQVNVQ